MLSRGSPFFISNLLIARILTMVTNFISKVYTRYGLGQT
ncbi:hypothetical protein SATMO3_60390 [Sporomusa aerivorans]